MFPFIRHPRKSTITRLRDLCEDITAPLANGLVFFSRQGPTPRALERLRWEDRDVNTYFTSCREQNELIPYPSQEGGKEGTHLGRLESTSSRRTMRRPGTARC